MVKNIKDLRLHINTRCLRTSMPSHGRRFKRKWPRGAPAMLLCVGLVMAIISLLSTVSLGNVSVSAESVTWSSFLEKISVVSTAGSSDSQDSWFSFETDAFEKMLQEVSKRICLKASLDSALSKYPGISASVSLIDLETGDAVNSGSGAVFTAASTTKVITAACFLSLVEQGQASLDSYISGCKAGSLIFSMINRSDNEAWWALKNWMGWDNVEAYAHQIGLTSFDIGSNLITAEDDARLLQDLYQGRLLNEGHTELLLSYMTDTNEEGLIPAALPDDATVYHKYGRLNSNLHDTSIIEYQGRAFVLVVFTEVQSWESGGQNTELIHEITRAALEVIDY